ncbi:MAG: CDP-archaeol synthase [Candidatus Levyibacteriota bacterium]
MNILAIVFFAFWFFSPAGLANVCAFASGKIRILRPLNQPVDFYLKFRGKRILGSHKTIRGFIVGILAAIIGVYLQVFFYNIFPWQQKIFPISYNVINPVVLGFLLGFGALAGDAIKSFFKRQMGIQPGRSWFPFDQIDYILGGIVFTWFYVPLVWYQYIVLFFVWFLIHPLATFIGFLFKLRPKPL